MCQDVPDQALTNFYDRLQAAKEAEVEGQVGDLSLNESQKAEEIEKRLPGGKVKKKASKEVVLEVSTRSKKKSVTTVLGTPFICC